MWPAHEDSRCECHAAGRVAPRTPPTPPPSARPIAMLSKTANPSTIPIATPISMPTANPLLMDGAPTSSLFVTRSLCRTSLRRRGPIRPTFSGPDHKEQAEEGLFEKAVAHSIAGPGSVTDVVADEAVSPREVIARLLHGSINMQTDTSHPRGCLVALSGTVRAPGAGETGARDAVLAIWDTQGRRRSRAPHVDGGPRTAPEPHDLRRHESRWPTSASASPRTTAPTVSSTSRSRA